MRLLIFTQAVDKRDPVLGFFHGWIECFAQRFERVTVVCLRKGEYALPKNVVIFSLGKEMRRSRFGYLAQFFYALFRFSRHNMVFVHMNFEYMLLGAWWWSLLRVKKVLWYNHRQGSWLVRAASKCATCVLYTSPDAYTASLPRAKQMPVGVDMTLFAPVSQEHTPTRLLIFGRLSPVKKIDVIIDALIALRDRNQFFVASLVGDPTDADSEFAAHVRERARTLVEGGILSVSGSVAHENSPALYQSHDIYINMTAPGSFDKTIIEAMACGMVVVARNDAVKDVLGQGWVENDSREALERSLVWALALTSEERHRVGVQLREYAKREHGLASLADKLSACTSS